MFEHTRIEWTEMLEKLQLASQMYKTVKKAWAVSDNGTESLEWTGGINHTTAVKLVTDGWKDAPPIEHIQVPDMNLIQQDIIYNYEVSGEILDISTYLTGLPEHWLSPEIVTLSGGNVLRISIEIGGLGSIEANELRNRGKAIVALVHSLELQGYSCEIDIIRAFLRRNTGEEIAWTIPLKKAGEALDTPRTQFVIGHPAFYRRCLISLNELDTRQANATKTLKYKPDGYDFHLHYEEGLSSSENQSMQWAKTKLEEFAHRGE